MRGIDSKYKISSFKAPKDFCRKGNYNKYSLGSFHVLNYSCPRQPEVNVLWGRNKVKIVNHIINLGSSRGDSCIYSY